MCPRPSESHLSNILLSKEKGEMYKNPSLNKEVSCMYNLDNATDLTKGFALLV